MTKLRVLGWGDIILGYLGGPDIRAFVGGRQEESEGRPRDEGNRVEREVAMPLTLRMKEGAAGQGVQADSGSLQDQPVLRVLALRGAVLLTF